MAGRATQKIPTAHELRENAVRTLLRENFPEETIVELVRDNYGGSNSELRKILKSLKE